MRFRASKTGLSPHQITYWPFQGHSSLAVLCLCVLGFICGILSLFVPHLFPLMPRKGCDCSYSLVHVWVETGVQTNATHMHVVAITNIKLKRELFTWMFPLHLIQTQDMWTPIGRLKNCHLILIWFYGPFKNISLISSRSFIKGEQKPENPGKNHMTIRKQNLAFPHVTHIHVTRARLEPQRWET